MNEQMNAPAAPEPSGFAGWFTTWINAVTKPSEQTYAAMAERPEAQTINQSFLWVFLAGTFVAIVSGVLSAILQMAGFTPQIPGFSELAGSAPRSPLLSLAISVCTSPISGALSVLFFAIYVGVIQWVAKMFKGTGTFSQLAYVAAAISVPFSVVTSPISPFVTLGTVGYCASGIMLLVGLYSIYLQLLAVKAVNKFGWGEAAGAYFLPLLFFVCICVCVSVAFGAAIASMLGQGFAP